MPPSDRICDDTPWQGWVFGVSTSGEAKARVGRHRIGQRRGHLAVRRGPDVATAPGGSSSPPATAARPRPPTPGTSPPASLGESVVHLAVQPNGELKAVDFFAPFDDTGTRFPRRRLRLGGRHRAERRILRHARRSPSSPWPWARTATCTCSTAKISAASSRARAAGTTSCSGSAPMAACGRGPVVWPGDGGWVYIPTASPSAQTGTAPRAT